MALVLLWRGIYRIPASQIYLLLSKTYKDFSTQSNLTAAYIEVCRVVYTMVYRVLYLLQCGKKSSSLKYIGEPISLETPMDVSLETPILSSKTMLFIEYPRFSLDPQICIENPKLFIGDPRFSLDTPYFIGKFQILQDTPKVFF